MSSEHLPQGWARSTIGDLATVKGGKRLPKGSTYSELPTAHPYVRVSDFSDGSVKSEALRYLTREVQEKISRYIISADDVYISIAGTIGVTGRIPPVLSGANLTENAAKISPGAALDPDFLHRVLSSYLGQRQIRQSTIATTQPKLALFRIEAIEVPVAPLPEQRRIVAKIEALQARSRAAREALEAIVPLLDRFRQSVFAAAFRGDLTADWRANNPDVEPASVLLERIRIERRRRWEEEQLAKMKAKGKEPKDEKWKAKYREPEPVDTEGLPGLPEGWCWASGAHLFTWGSGKFLPGREIRRGPIPVYGGNGLSDWHQGANVTHATVVVGRVGAHCGNVHQTEGPAWVTDNAIFATTASSLVRLAFAVAGLRAVGLNQHAKGGGQPFVSQTMLDEAVLPVPPLAEQDALLMQVVEMHSRVAVLIEGMHKCEKEGERLNQSILAKAFRGELVPQDPDDEPASVLLERIRAERAAAAPEKKTRGRRGKKAKAKKATAKKAT